MLDQLSLQERAPIISAISVRTVERLPVHFVLLEKVALLHRECNNRGESAKFITAVEGHYQKLSVRPITGRRSLAPSSCTRRPIDSPDGWPSTWEERRAYRVPLLCPSEEGPPFPPAVPVATRRDV